MAVLSEGDRVTEWAKFMSDLSNTHATEISDLTKSDVRAAIDATDTWVNDNAAAYNAALPVAARTALSASQKAKLLMEVVRRRFEVA